MTTDHTLLAILSAPVLTAVLVRLFRRTPNLRDIVSVVGGLASFSLVASKLLPSVARGNSWRLEIAEVLPGIQLAFVVEPLGAIFATLATGLWVVTTVYAIGYLRGNNEIHQTRFFMCFAIAIAAAIGVALAANLFTLFIFYELITISTYPLVTHHGTARARSAGRAYLGILMGTSVVFLLPAIVWTHHLTGTTEFARGGILAGSGASSSQLVLLLALFAFGTAKAALMPFHRWLPSAMVAPTPVSALLHAVAVVKAGVFTILKVVVYIFGLDVLSTTGASRWLAWAAALTLVFAAVGAIRRQNLKARLAYSTISQLAYIVLGAALANRWGIVGGALHMVMHAFAKITLFFCAGTIYVATHKTEIPQLAGLARRMPWTFAAFFVGSLGVIGLPPTGASWSKWYLALGTVDAGDLWLLAILMVSSLLAIGYLMPVVTTGVIGSSPSDPGKTPPTGSIQEGPLLCVLPAVVTATGCILLFFYAGRGWSFVEMILSP